MTSSGCKQNLGNAMVRKREQISLETWDKVANFVASYKVGLDFLNAAMQLQKEFNVDMYDALSKGQLSSKVWALRKLHSYMDRKDAKIAVCGGWYGTLPAMAFASESYFSLRPIFNSIDLDPNCEEVANRLNHLAVARGQFTASTSNMYDHDYAPYHAVINTSCEHIEDISRWLDLLPERTLVLMQNNNYFEHMEHVNCVSSLDEFIDKAPLKTVEYAGEMILPLYTRYMLIGTK
jgi:hypothetical protein